MKKAPLKKITIFTGKLQACNLKRDSNTVVFKNTCYEEYLLTSASDFLKQLQNTGGIFYEPVMNN